MKVLLVIPTYLYDIKYPAFVSNSDFPVGFAYLASALKSAGFLVFGLNPNNDTSYACAHEMLTDKLVSMIEQVKPEIIGIGGLCTDYKFLKDCIAIIRYHSPQSKIVMGGGIITNDPAFIFSQLKPDYCIIGEGEEVLVKLLLKLKEEQPDLSDIHNIGYWKDGKPFFTRKNFSYPDLNDRLFPDYEPFGINSLMDNYSHAARYLYRYTRLDPRPMTIITGRGCPFSCTFCVHQEGMRYRTRSMDNIISEITFLYERYRFNILIILDELFAAHKDRVREFSLAVLKGKRELGWDFDWLFQTHASSSLDEETLRLAKEAGCYYFSYGLESASPAVIASMNKKNTPEQIVRAISVAEKSNIGFGGNFIFGDLVEDLTSICETMDFFKTYCRDNHVFLTYIQPYPGSRLYEECVERGIIENKIDSYDSINSRIYNMTRIPTILWMPWLRIILNISACSEWCKSAVAYRIEEDVNFFNKAVIARERGSLYDFNVICPFCGYDNKYREIVYTPQKSILDTLYKKTIRFVMEIVSTLLGIFIPAFRKISYLKSKTPISESSFITGCKKCNKRYNVIYTI